MACDIKTLMKERLINDILSLDPSYKYENDNISIDNTDKINTFLSNYPQYKNTIIIDGNKVYIDPEVDLLKNTAESIEKERIYKTNLDVLINDSELGYYYNGEYYESSDDLYNATLGDLEFMEMQSKINNSEDLKVYINNISSSKYNIEKEIEFNNIKEFNDFVPFLDSNTKEILDLVGDNIELSTNKKGSYFDININNIESINIDPIELSKWSENVSFSKRKLLNIVFQHELYHAASYKMIENGKYNKEIRSLLQIARKYHINNKKFDDKFRASTLFENGLPYALGFSSEDDNDIFEFTAEAFANPWFKDWLKSIPVDESKKSVFDKIIDLIKSFFGIKNASYLSLYDEINNYLVKLVDNKDQEILENTQDITLYANKVFTSNQIMVKFLEANKLEPIINNKIEELVNSFKKIRDSIPRDKKNKSVAYDKISNSLKLLDKNEDILTLSSIISQMTITRSILEDIELATKDSLKNAKNTSEKITILHLGLKEIKAFDDYIKLSNSIITELNNLEEQSEFIKSIKEGDRNIQIGEGHKYLLRILEGVTSPKVRLEEELKTLIGDPIYSYLYELVDDDTKNKVKEYEKEILSLEKKLEDPQFPNKKYIKDKIEKIEKEILSKFPKDAEWFKRELSGDTGELGVYNIWLEAAQQSKSPLIQIVSKQFKDIDNENNRENLKKSNEIQGLLDELIKTTGSSKLNLENLYKPILTQVEVIEEIDDNGNITESFKRDSLLNIYTSEYYKEYNRLKKITSKTGYELSSTRIKSIKDPNNEELSKELKLKKSRYDKAVDEFNKFKEQNVEREYTDLYYQTQELYSSPISSEYPDISLKSTYSDIYHTIDVLQLELNNELAEGVKEANFDELEDLKIELRQIESLDDKEEGSLEWLLAKKAIEYKEAKAKLGKTQLLPENKIFFDKLLKSKENEFKKGYLNKEQYNFWLQQNTKTLAKEEWYTERSIVFAKLAELSEQLDKIMSEADSSLSIKKIYDNNKENRLVKNDLYQQLRELVKPFRDNNNVTNGILIERYDRKNNKNIVQQVKSLDEQIELFNQMISSLKTGVSKMDIQSGTKSSKQDKDQLKAEKEELGISSILDEMDNLFFELGMMSETVNTHYYDTRKELEIDKIASEISEEELSELIEDDQITLNNVRYIYSPETLSISYVSNGKVVSYEGTFTREDFLGHLRREKAKEKLNQSDWYKNNHYTTYRFDEETNRYIEKEEPIYIWLNNIPSDNSYITTVPSSKYFTYIINDEFINKNHVKLPDGLELPKSTSNYINNDYIRLKNSDDPKDKAYYNLLTRLRSIYYESQEKVSFNNKFGDSTPSLLKTSQERKTDGFLKLTNPGEYKSYLKDIYRSYLKEDSQELNNELMGMSSKEFIENKEIPELLVGKLDSDKQSKNIVGSILIHSLMASKRNKLQQIQPFMDSLLELASEGKVKKESKSVTGKLIKTIKGDNSKTGLYTALKGFIESELYYHRIDDVKYTVFGMDLNKILNSVMKANAFGAFAGNIYNPVKNTISGKIQSFIEHNKKLGRYTDKQWLRAEKKSFMMTNQLMTSFAKFGKKPLDVQLLDYFNVLQGTRSDILGNKTQWNGLRDFTELLSAPKDYSEFQLQLAQYLALADNTYLSTKEGKKRLLECFELDKSGNVKPKSFITDLNKFNKEINKFTFILHDLNLRLNGAYRQEESSLVQKNILGRAAFFMNKYLLPMLVRRYSDYRYYVAEDDVRRGFYRDAITFLFVDTFKGLKQGKGIDLKFISRYNNLSDQEKYNLIKTLREALVIMCLTLLIGGITGGDDDKNISTDRKLALAYLMGISMETQTFNPVAGADDMIRKLKNPFVFARTLQTTRNALYYALMSLIGSDEAEYKRKSGSHNAGDSKAMANFMRLLSFNPGNIATFDPQTLYQNQKAFYSGQMR